MLSARSKLAPYLVVVWMAVAVVLVLGAPLHWLKLVGGGLLACGPIGCALIYWAESDEHRGRVLSVVASLVIVVAATGVTALLVAKHPSTLFSVKPRVVKVSPAPGPPKPRIWHGIAQPLGIPGNWNLVLNSEFTGSTLNTAVWRPGWRGTGITSPTNTLEEDCYSSGNVTLGGGALHLAVTAVPSTCGGVSHPYTGALITTNPYDGRRSGGFEYTYGVLEARVYLPAAGTGTRLANWPAIWAMGQDWPYDGEDDVMEGLFGVACFHIHSVNYAEHGPGGCDTSIAPGWHTFASVWQPGQISYYYDGIHVGTVTQGITSEPMFIILDNTVWKNTPKETRPDSMQVAYVRVWQAPGSENFASKHAPVPTTTTRKTPAKRTTRKAARP